MVINAINNFLCHFFFAIADKSLERKAIREKMLLKILSSRPRVESKGTSSFPRKLFQRKATSRKNTMRNFLCRKFTLGSMSIRKPKERNSLLKIFFSSNKIHPRVESRATSPRSKRDSPSPSEGKQFFVKKCYQKFSSSTSQIHSRIGSNFFSNPFEASQRKAIRLRLQKFSLTKCIESNFSFSFSSFFEPFRNEVPLRIAKESNSVSRKNAQWFMRRARHAWRGDVCRWPVVLPFPWAPGSLFRGRATASSIHIGPRSVPRWLPYCMSHCRRTPRDGEGREEEEEEDERGGWKEGGWGGR